MPTEAAALQEAFDEVIALIEAANHTGDPAVQPVRLVASHFIDDEALERVAHTFDSAWATLGHLMVMLGKAPTAVFAELGGCGFIQGLIVGIVYERKRVADATT